ncbi:hypothetical protein L580_0613 [Serratia fonticola AU-P3(3)]|jgi:hypothetical protein|nr:hypothetical protein L580_0613 [Serratia fonticola AU-P3(3)]
MSWASVATNPDRPATLAFSFFSAGQSLSGNFVFYFDYEATQ